MNASRATAAPRRRERIEISIPLRKRYVPGTGPKSRPISLLPPRDSDAFIVDKVIDPATSLPGKLGQKKICYIIGWPDLPAARVLIPCCRALEYVSPGTMEDWEYRDALRREEEQWASAVDEAKALSLQEVARKPRGRPPRGSYAERPASPPPVLDRKTEERIARKKASGAPSLSTPSKRRLADFLEVVPPAGAEDVTDEDDDEQAIMMQLQGEFSDGALDAMAGFGLSSEQSEEDMDVDLVPGGGAPVKQETRVPIPSYGGGPTPMQQVKTENPSVASSAPPAFPLKRPETRISPPRFGMNSQSKPAKAIPGANGHALFASKPPQKSKLTAQRNKTGSKTQNGTSTIDRPAKTPHTANGIIGPSSFYSGKDQPKQPAYKKPKPSPGPLDPMLGLQTKQDHAAPLVQTNIQEEQAYEVKRLEGDQWFDLGDGGPMVRYYKVRWEGDWPADQNPTWEPEENISRSLVRKYLKHKEKKSGGSQPSTPRKQQQGTEQKKKKASAQRTLSPWMGRKFSSVQEAFEGEDDTAGESQRNGVDALQKKGEGEEQEEAEEDELMVTEDKPSHSVSSPPPPRASLGVNLARQFTLFGKK